jgi:hypothetical protein
MADAALLVFTQASHWRRVFLLLAAVAAQLYDRTKQDSAWCAGSIVVRYLEIFAV